MSIFYLTLFQLKLAPFHFVNVIRLEYSKIYFSSANIQSFRENLFMKYLTMIIPLDFFS